MGNGVVGVPAGKILLGDFVEGKVDGVGRAGAEAHGPYASVESGWALCFDDGAESLGDSDGFDGAGTDGLHVGLDGVDWEHGHVFDGAGDGAGDHELVESESVGLGGWDDDGGVEVRWLWDRTEVVGCFCRHLLD